MCGTQASTQDGTQDSTQDSTQASTQDSTQDSTTLNKLNKTKQNKTKQEKKNKKEKRFVPPSLEEVTNYVNEKGLKVDATRFFNYYEATEWKDAKGNQVLSWKGKLQTWDGRAKENTNNNKPATFDDLLREEYGENDEKRNSGDTGDNSDSIYTILSGYTVE